MRPTRSAARVGWWGSRRAGGCAGGEDYCTEVPENSPAGVMFRDLPARINDPDGAWLHVITAGCESVLTSQKYNYDAGPAASCWKGYTDDDINTMMVNNEMKIVFNEGGACTLSQKAFSSFSYLKKPTGSRTSPM